MRPRLRRRILLGLVACSVVLGLAGTSQATAQEPRSQINGTGSTYVGLAMQQWTAEGQVLGLRVNYTPTGSPDGLSRYNGGQVDFAGTEAEFSSLGLADSVSRGYQYVPSVAGAVAVMYNVRDAAGREVDYLHLSRSTVAKIFMGYITSWADPAIAADNAPARLALPDQPINVVYRSGQSGTTALFYDFVRETEPALFREWASRNRLNPDIRIIQLDGSPGFAPRTQALSGSDQIAQFTASAGGLWSIAYDEFGYAKVYDANSAWIENAAGRYVLPYAENISAALESARLRPDLTQELSGVYASTNPLAYPISAYSYIVSQCDNPGDRPTCRGTYANAGVTNTLTAWLRYIACDGQIRMAQIGYSPLPPNLSQEVVNSIARMNGQPAEQLSAGNCANPRFRGSLGAGATSPPDPYLALGGGGGDGGGGTTTTTPGGTGATSTTVPGSPPATAVDPVTGETLVDTDGDGIPDAALPDDDTQADPSNPASRRVGGGSEEFRVAAPVAYEGELPGESRWPLLVLALALLIPTVVPPLVALLRRRRPG